MKKTATPLTVGKPRALVAVVVTYRPLPEVSVNVSRIAHHGVTVLVVDNGSGEEFDPALKEVAALPDTQLIRNHCNLGIASALNIGIRKALELGAEWIATFDQDSSVVEDFFAAELGCLKNCHHPESVALISPRHLEPDSDAGIHEASCRTIRTAMTSGSLIRASVFERVGYYDESLFIDYVDFDFCLRLWQHGFRVVRSGEARLLHRLGSAETHPFLGMQIKIKTHRAWRRYYIMRNRVLIYRRYCLHFPGWCVRDIGWMLLDFAKILAFEHDKAAKLGMAFKGLLHGLAGKTGPLLHPA